MSAAALFLHLPPSSTPSLRSKHGGATASTPPGFLVCRSRRRHSSSSPRSALMPAKALAAAAVRAGAGAVGGDGAGGMAVAPGGGGTGHKTLGEAKAALFQSLQGINKGIFGVQTQRRGEIEGLVRLLELHNPTPHPTEHLDQVDGCWKLLYTSVTILGSKRTKLGLRDFVSLGDFFQKIDVAQLMNLFQKNYDLLLAIFNPEGWLEITYVDESLRIGRDDKGNIFILGRTSDQKA